MRFSTIEADILNTEMSEKLSENDLVSQWIDRVASSSSPKKPGIRPIMPNADLRGGFDIAQN